MSIGLDIGGTKVASALLGDAGDVLSTTWHEHAARGIDDVAAELAATVHRLPDRPEARSIGVSVSGLVRRDGVVTGGATLDLHGDLAGALRQRLERPVHVFNDADATLRSVLDAHHAETGERVRDAVLLTIGTGIGGAVLSDGRPVRGPSGLASELGHLPVHTPSTELCVCGSSGCLEQYAGGLGIATLARRAVREGRASAHLHEVDASSAGGITAKDVVAATRAGDPSATALLDQAAASCAQAIRALCVTIEPAIVFLGGSVAHGAADFLPSRIEHHLRAHWPFARLTAPPPVQLDSIGPHAAAIGAALLLRDLEQPAPGHPSAGTALEGIDNG